MELEFSAFSEFAEARPKAHEIRSCNRDGQTHRGLRDVEYAVFLETETVGFILSVNKVDQVFAFGRGSMCGRIASGWYEQAFV